MREAGYYWLLPIGGVKAVVGRWNIVGNGHWSLTGSGSTYNDGQFSAILERIPEPVLEKAKPKPKRKKAK